MLFYTDYSSPVGELNLVSDGKNLVGLWFYGQKYFQKTVDDELCKNSDLDILKDTEIWLDNYFNGLKPDINELNLKPKGSEFQKKVWKILCTIEYGETMTYGEIAEAFKPKNMSAQAVGGAVSHNPISIIVPCHRVMGADNRLTGFSAGVSTKLDLLKHEGINTKKFKM